MPCFLFGDLIQTFDDILYDGEYVALPDQNPSYVSSQDIKLISIYLPSISFYSETHKLALNEGTRYSFIRWIYFSRCFLNYYRKTYFEITTMVLKERIFFGWNSFDCQQFSSSFCNIKWRFPLSRHLSIRMGLFFPKRLVGIDDGIFLDNFWRVFDGDRVLLCH